MLKIYGMIASGNCYKPRLLLAKLGIPFRHVETSGSDGGTRSAAFLAKNPNGQVPLLELDDGRVLAESNAMLLYLGEGTRFVPEDRYDRGVMAQWLFFEQYSHEPSIAVRRALTIFPNRAADATPQRMAATLTSGLKALDVMEAQLAKTPFIAGHAFTLADIALYAYTHVADEGGFDLGRFPAIGHWLDRVRLDRGHVSMNWLG